MKILRPDTSFKFTGDPQHHDLILLEAHSYRKLILRRDINVPLELSLEKRLVIYDHLIGKGIVN